MPFTLCIISFHTYYICTSIQFSPRTGNGSVGLGSSVVGSPIASLGRVRFLACCWISLVTSMCLDWVCRADSGRLLHMRRVSKCELTCGSVGSSGGDPVRLAGRSGPLTNSFFLLPPVSENNHEVIDTSHASQNKQTNKIIRSEIWCLCSRLLSTSGQVLALRIRNVHLYFLSAWGEIHVYLEDGAVNCCLIIYQSYHYSSQK